METRRRVISTSLEEDFQTIGVPLDKAEQAGLSGILIEDVADDQPHQEPAKTESVDAIDGPTVTRELLERVANLPFENFEMGDFDELLDALKKKVLPEGDAALATMAEEVVKKIMSEAVAKRTRVFKKRSMAKKVRLQCEPGFRHDPNDPSGKRCIRAVKAAGGAGKLRKQERKKLRWSKSGKGAKSKKISSRFAARRPGTNEESISPFAAELAALNEGASEINESVRDEIMGRIERIFLLLGEEFLDASVNEIYESAYSGLCEAWEAGRLDEEVMESEDFLAEVKPALSLILKSIDRLNKIDDGEMSGN